MKEKGSELAVDNMVVKVRILLLLVDRLLHTMLAAVFYHIGLCTLLLRHVTLPSMMLVVLNALVYQNVPITSLRYPKLGIVC